jgi:hypothetical protein
MKKTVLLLPVTILVLSCSPEREGGDALFSLMDPEETGLDFTNTLTETEEFNIIDYLYFNNGGGVAAGDINNDGFTDLYFTSNQHSNRLYLNRGDMMFEEITEAAGVAGTGDWSTGVTMADVNGDGFLDIYVCQVGNYKGLEGRNQLFINQGDLRFKEQAKAYGLDFQGFSTQAAFFDYDTDGDLDMYLLNHSVHTSRSYGGAELRYEEDARAGDRLYRNEQTGNGIIFTDVTEAAGIFSSHIGYGLGVRICDINNDGFPDIYISNDFHENDYLYVNNGNGTFSERLREMIAHTSRSSMGNDAGDINNDGLLDVVVLDMLPDKQQILKRSGGEDEYDLYKLKLRYGYSYQFVRNTLQLNMGNGMFSEIGRLAGIYATDWSWSPLFCDVDNDGWKDLFITNGIYRRANDLDYVRFITGGEHNGMRDLSDAPDRILYEKMPLYPNVNYLFRNNGDLTFVNMAGTWGFDRRSYSNGSTFADLDNDGDLDLVVNNINEPAFLLRNEADRLLNNHYLSIALKGKGLNTYGIGGRVSLYVNEQVLVSEQYNTRGFLSATPLLLHFGVGMHELIDSLVVRWPDRSENTIYQIAADQLITLEWGNGTESGSRGSGRSPTEEADAAIKPLFSEAEIPGLTFQHRENAYEDLIREKLIPHNLSAEGPALAVGDVNGDGLDDLFLGGATGQQSVLLAQLNEGSFHSLSLPRLPYDHLTEDVDASFFDADGDGDADLYLVRGGNEYPFGHPVLSDQLLINNGSGNFSPAEAGSIPEFASNGSCARPVDFDGDGDQDLFVGSRSVPGSYGMSPIQYLLENNGSGVFTDVTDRKAGELKNAGMVTDALWTDMDLDGDPDLVVVGEWMNITVFGNEHGAFSDITSRAGLDETSGWWNCIEAADVDSDGDPDLIGGNLGLNSILKASIKEPVEMFVNDFNNDGSLDQVICAYQDGTSYPVASLDELASQIRGIRAKYPTYDGFAGKRAKDVFEENKLNRAGLKKAVVFETSLFLNNGDGSFGIQVLPVEAQISPVRGIVAIDINRDGIKDIVLGGNNYAARPSLGRYDAGFGWLMTGVSDHVFRIWQPRDSGLRITGDARSILPIEIDGQPHLVAAVNNGPLQVFRY